MSAGIDTIVWDLGGVLVDWNPLFVYNEQYFNSPSDRDYFFSHICTSDWNEQQDAGYSLQQATADKLALFPEEKWQQPIRDFYGRWTDMLRGPLPDTVDIFRRLKERGQFKFFALTNWSAETFPVALKKFDFLHWFEGIIVSGTEKTRKPFAEIYQLTLDRFQLNPQESVFIDDNARNIDGAQALGIHGIHFLSPEQLKSDLVKLGIDI